MPEGLESCANRRCLKRGPTLIVCLTLISLVGGCNVIHPKPLREPSRSDPVAIQLGPRPFYLMSRMEPGALRERLEACSQGPFRASPFSIGHRGAPLQFPEHTRESYLAAARMGAGSIECDVTFTADHALVCRHAQCDLATTTDILETPLAARCSEGFRPATFDAESGELLRPASARCCTDDLSLGEFRKLEGRMDASNPRATTIAEYLDATPAWRTDLYSNGGTLMTHAESIELFRGLGVSMIPELKSTGFDRSDEDRHASRDRAKRLLDAYREAGVPPEDVAFQSFDADDIRFWIDIAPAYGARAIWLTQPAPSSPTPSTAEFEALWREGFRTIAPPISMLLRLDEEGILRATEYAKRARAAGLEIITWTLERSGRIRDGRIEGRASDFYLGPLLPGLVDDGDIYRIVDALAQKVKIRALFSDWPATTTYYANCLGLD
ncbi:MAG: glycerophosphodiester phosphodiesterase [bacterium]|nr:glycerophosphodiester phosphodiesterase [bacterium]